MWAVHVVRAHWHVVVAAVILAVLAWACLPAPLKTKLTEGWKKFGHAIGNFQARLLLTILYGILILPFGLMVRLFSDSLHIKKRTTSWLEYPPVPKDIERARHQG